MTHDFHSEEQHFSSISGHAQSHTSSHEEGKTAGAGADEMTKEDENAKSLKAKILGHKTISGKKSPSLYRVVLLHDDFTPEAFILAILRNCFGYSEKDSQDFALEMQQKGSGVVGIYSYEVAETKMDQVGKSARKVHYPLQCTLERIDT